MEQKKKSKRESSLERKLLELRRDIFKYIDEQMEDAAKRQLAGYIEDRVTVVTTEKLDKKMSYAIKTLEKKINEVLNIPLSVKQVALLAGRTEASIYKMCQRDQIPHVKNGKVIHIFLRDVNDMLLCLKD